MKKLLLLALIFISLNVASQCSISFLHTNTSGSNPNAQYQVTFEIQFTNSPATGSLVFQVDDGQNIYDTLISAPFTSPTTGTLSFLPANGNFCTTSAYFSNDPGCTINGLGYTAPTYYPCIVDGGTHTETILGNSTIPGVLTWGDELTLSTNNDYVHHDSVPNLNHDPGFGYLVFTCPPDTSQYPASDTCLFDVAGYGDIYQEVNDGNNLYYTIPTNEITNNTIYLVPMPFYSMTDITLAWQISGQSQGLCYDWGNVFPITYLDAISVSIAPNPQTGEVNFTLSGAYPALNGSNFSISNVSPASATVSQTTVGNNGSFILSNLHAGDLYSFTVTDDAGSTRYVTGMYLDAPDIGLGAVQVGPNPFHQIIRVRNIPEGAIVQLSDAQGRIIQSTEGTSTVTMHTDKLGNGVYLLTIQVGESQITHKLLK